MILQDSIAYFTAETRIMPGLSVACGTADSVHTAQGGWADEQKNIPLTEDSIFDLASLTKLFTGLMVMRLEAEGKLALSKPVTSYAPRFARLDQVSVDAVLGFEVGLTTPARVDAAPSPGEAKRLLFAIQPGPVTGRAYSDMHAMVLRYVIEGASQQSYAELLSQCILQPVGMKNTTHVVDETRRSLCVSCDMEHRIERGRYILRRTAPGFPHDPKAAVLYPDPCGHAGLFSTRGDMVKLCQALLKGDVIPRESLFAMSRNRTGHLRPDGTYQQYLGAQCYVKHPIQRHSEVPPYMGEKAISLSGFTGHHVSVDAERGLFALFLGSRCQNRLTVLIPEEGKSLTDYGLNPDGTGQVLWPDGTRVWSSVQYVYHKDAHFHGAVAAELGLNL
ncbi:MAG: beta-lactamase family protein [Clostridia bacterium]|nr:beta-lactamase family protein [Clostridia bacterium]